MKRLTPLSTTDHNESGITSIQLSASMRTSLDMEKLRINARSRSEVIRLILEQYFEEAE